jgi:hypothetical protein
LLLAVRSRAFAGSCFSPGCASRRSHYGVRRMKQNNLPRVLIGRSDRYQGRAELASLIVLRGTFVRGPRNWLISVLMETRPITRVMRPQAPPVSSRTLCRCSTCGA